MGAQAEVAETQMLLSVIPFGAMEALRALGSFAAELALAQAAQAEAEEAQGEVADEWPGRVALRWY